MLMPFALSFVGATRVSLEFQTEHAVERIETAAVDENHERGNGPHQRIFETELVPKILADAPAFDIGDQQENQNDSGNRPREQSEREERPADKPRDRDR